MDGVDMGLELGAVSSDRGVQARGVAMEGVRRGPGKRQILRSGTWMRVGGEGSQE
jgi:hypothetical protein